MNEYEPPLMPYDPDLHPSFDWTTFGLALGGGAAVLALGYWIFFRR